MRRAFGAFVGVFALFLVFAGTARANHDNGNGGGNGNGCNAPGNAYGHDNCDSSSDPPAPASPDSTPPDSEPAAPPAEPTEDPSSGVSTGEPLPEESPAPSTDGGPESAPPIVPTESSNEQEATPPSSQPDTPAPPAPAPPAEGWAPVVARPERPAADPAPRPAAARARAFSSASAPEASWSTPEASWSQGRAQSVESYGVTGMSAIVALRHGAGVVGGLAFRVQMTQGHSTFAFRASRSIVASGGGRLYRIGAWLRSDIPGLSVCLRIQEVSRRDTLTPVRTSESCLATTANWKHFKLYRRTLARGNRLVFSIYSFGAVEGDSFDVDGFTVSRRVKNGWKRVTAAFGKPTDSA